MTGPESAEPIATDAPRGTTAPAGEPGDGSRALRLSAALTLVALGLMAWSMLEPTPLPVMLAMTVGQAIGSAAFAIYLYVVVRALRRERRDRRGPT